MLRCLPLLLLGFTPVPASAQGELRSIAGPGSSVSHGLGRFGSSVGDAGDIDGDGASDVIVGDPWQVHVLPVPTQGAADVFSGQTGALLLAFRPQVIEDLGLSVAALGDVDADGIDDFLVTGDDNGDGTVRVYSGADASVLREMTDFGEVAAGAGDVTGDGVPDWIAAQPLNSGVARVVSGSDGAIVYTYTGAPGDVLGSALAGGVDVDGDSTPDFLIGLRRPSSNSPPGSARLHSGADGSLIFEVAGSENGGDFGGALAFLDDTNGDGIPDIAVGEPSAVDFSGRLWVFSGADGSLLHSFVGVLEGQLGYAVASAGDLDGDGRGDILASSPTYSELIGGVQGRMTVYSGASGAVLWQVQPSGDAELGRAVAAVGDRNGDRIPDFAGAAPFMGSGIALVYSGATGQVLETYAPAEWSLAFLGDLEGDGFPELLIGTPGRERATVHSMGAGTERHLDGSPATGLGTAVAGIGDVNGDARDDVVLGLPFANVGEGAVEVRSGLDGSLLYAIDGTNTTTVFGSSFGAVLAPLGDLDADGRGDLAVAAWTEPVVNKGRPGVVRVYSGASGGLLFEVEGANDQDFFGFALAGGEDFDGDGTPDLLVGVPGADGGGSFSGELRVLSGLDGSTLLTVDGPVAGSWLGTAAAFLGDVDGDGTSELAVGATENFAPGVGAVFVYSGADGTLLYEIREEPGARGCAHRFGESLAAIGDVNGDGLGDLAVGFPCDAAGGSRAGAVRVFSAADGTFLAEYVGPGPNSGLGTTLAGGLDADADGVPDFATGAPEEQTVGVVRVLDGGCLQATPYCTALPNSTGVPARIGGQGLTSVSANAFALTVADAPPNRFGLFFFGTSAIDTPFGDGRRCVGGSPLRLRPSIQIAPDGTVQRPLDFSAAPLAGAVQPGGTLRFQFWHRDPMGPGGSGFNLTGGLAVTFCP